MSSPVTTPALSARPPMLVLGQRVHVLVDARQSGGAYSLFELECPPGTGTPPHQETGDETFYVVDGTLTFRVGGETVTAGAGECVFIPRGTPHLEANTSDAPARALTLSTLAARKEGMFAALAAIGAEAAGGPPDVGRIVAACAEHGVEILLPS